MSRASREERQLSRRLREIDENSIECGERGHVACLKVMGGERQKIYARQAELRSGSARGSGDDGS